MRMTRQRQVILEELGKVTSHPTADEVYQMVRRRLPRISLGTIYRNLDILSQKGVILRLSSGGPQRRFDATVEPHYHIVCEECGRTDDLPIPLNTRLDHLARKACKYKVRGHTLVFCGVCPECRQS